MLIVDSDPAILEPLQKILTAETSYEVRTAPSSFLAGIECERFRPHVMLIDIHLAEGDAAKLCEHLRRNDDLLMTRIIAMSGKLTEGQIAQLTSKGFDGFLRKPFNARQVVECIETAHAVVY